MVGGKHDSLRIDRRTALKLAAGAGLAATSALQMPRAARADNTTLSIWTGYPELVPYYQAVAEAYAKTNPGVKLHHPQHLAARARAEALGRGADRHRPRHLRHRHQHHRQLHRGRADRAERRRRSTSICKSGAWTHSHRRLLLGATARPTACRCSSARRRSTTTRRCSRRPASPSRRRPSRELIDAAQQADQDRRHRAR